MALLVFHHTKGLLRACGKEDPLCIAAAAAAAAAAAVLVVAEEQREMAEKEAAR